MNKTLRKVLKFVLIVGCVAIAIWLIYHYGVERLRAQVEHMGVWAPLGLFTLRFISVIIPALPSTVWSLVAGSLLANFWIALATVFLADLFACSLAFYLAKQFGRDLVTKLVGTQFMARVDNLSQRHLESNFFLLTGFLMTGLFDFVSYGAGLTTTQWKQFFPALCLGLMISHPPIVAIGAGMFAKGNGQLMMILAVLGIFSLAILTGWLQRRTSPSTSSKSEETL
ncbi:MAG: TVP38/TMEM64 family protein [Acaryochloridaceae cyanobacterium CSU_3_4]|nr:TVP38/TMEM64 family protein [Acaryochloridaceae cyanobacterium CSU_3_4]